MSTPASNYSADGVPSAFINRLLGTLFAALRYKNYRLYFIGQIVSWTGTWMHNVAQGWLVLRLSDSALLLGLASAVGSVAVIFLSLPAGIIVDRVSKQRLLLFTQIAAMIVVLGLSIAVLTDHINVWGVIGTSFLLGVVSSFDAPTRHALMMEITAKEDLLNAIALNSSIWHIARFIGPAIAGAIVARHGEGTVFLVNAASFVAIIYCICKMDVVPQPEREEFTTRQSLAESFRFVREKPPISALLILAGGLSFFGFAYLPILPLFARDVLGQDVVGLGILLSLSGVGALLAALTLAGFGTRIHRGKLLAISAICFPVALTLFALSPNFQWALPFAAFASWSGVTTMILVNGALQARSPQHLRGRIISLFTLALFGVGPLGGVLLGALIEISGHIRLMFGLSAAIAAIVSAYSISTLRALRALRRGDVEVAVEPMESFDEAV